MLVLQTILLLNCTYENYLDPPVLVHLGTFGLGLFCYDLGDQEKLCLFLFWMCNVDTLPCVGILPSYFWNIQTE